MILDSTAYPCLGGRLTQIQRPVLGGGAITQKVYFMATLFAENPQPPQDQFTPGVFYLNPQQPHRPLVVVKAKDTVPGTDPPLRFFDFQFIDVNVEGDVAFVARLIDTNDQLVGSGVFVRRFCPTAPTLGNQCVEIIAANPPLDNPYLADMQPFRDVLDTGTGATLTRGIGGTGTPAEGPVTYSPISVTFSATPPAAPTTGNITVTCTGGTCPTVSGVTGTGAGPYLVSLSQPIPPGHCTTFKFDGTYPDQKLEYQSLPGDSGMDGTTNTQDLQELVSALNNGDGALSANLPRYDANRNGVANTQDLLRITQLLNGTLTTQAWNGVTVQLCPN